MEEHLASKATVIEDEIDSEGEVDETQNDPPMLTRAEMHGCMQKMKLYACSKAPEILGKLYEIETAMSNIELNKAREGRQLTLDNFFVRQ